MEMTDDEVFGQPDQPQGEMSDAEVFGQGAGAPPVQPQGELSDADVFGTPERQQPPPGEEYSPIGSAAMGFAHGAAPAVGGIQAGLAAGAATATALAPAGPLVAGAGGIIAGLGAGLGVGKLIEMGEDKFLALIGADKSFEAARASNPDTYDIAGMIPAAASLRGGGTLAARAIGAGIGGAAETGMEAMGDEPFSWKKIAAATAMGGALPNVNKFGQAAVDVGERAGKSALPFVSARYRGGNTNPDLKPVEGETPAEHAAEPAPQEDEITVANDQPQVAAGIAVEQPPAAEIPGVGNPTGAPMVAREGARPSEPGRNYEKGQPQTQPEVSDNKVLDITPQPADVDAALGAAPGEALPPGRTDVLHQEASPTPITDESQVGHYPGPEEFGRPEQVYDEAPPIQPEAPEQDNHTPGLRQRTQTSLDPVEASRLQREALQGVQDRMAAQQKGEDFHDLPPTDEKPTPAQQEQIDKGLKMLVDHGWSKGIEAVKRLPVTQQLELIRESVNAEHTRAAEQAGNTNEKMTVRPTGEERVERHRTIDTGAKVATKEDAARKQGTIDKYRQLFDQFGPRSEHGKTFDPSDVTSTRMAKSFTKPTWDKVVEAFGGDPFGKGSGKAYLPRMADPKTKEAIEWLRAVKKSALRSEHKDFLTAHSAKEEGKDVADLMATGRKIDADIERGASAEHTADTIMGREENKRVVGREEIEPFDNSDQGESQIAAKQHQDLRDWVNGLSDEDYNRLSIHHDIGTEVRSTQDPAKTKLHMEASLEGAQAEDAKMEVKLKPKRLKLPTVKANNETKETVTLRGKNGELLPGQTRAAAANEGRKLDKNSDEFKRLAAMYAGQEVKPRSIADSVAKEKAILEAEQRSSQRENERAALDGTSEKAVLDKMTGFLKDTSGEVKIPEVLKRMFSNPADPTTPGAAPGAKEYADTLNKSFGQLGAKIKNTKVEIMAGLAKAADSGLTPEEHRQIAIAEQDNRTAALPQKLKDFYTEQVVPIRERALDAMRKFKELNDEHGLGYNIDDLNKVTTKAYQPRYDISEQSFGREGTEAFDPFTGKGLGDFTPNVEPRKFFALENGNERMTMEVAQAEDGTLEAKIHRGAGRVVTIRDLPDSFQGKLGDTLMLNVKGQKGKWTVDQATTQEITKDTGGKVKYVENPVWAWSRMLDDTSRAYEQAKLAVDIKNDPRFKDFTTTDPKVARERGYSTKVTTHLPDFAKAPGGGKLYMADPVRWAFDDYHKPGFGEAHGEGIEALRNFNVALLKVFNTNAPLVHVLNELDLFTVGRGFKWISPKAYYQLATAAPKAFKSVNTQDALQAEMRRAGVNPMLASVGMRSMYEKAAKNMGVEIIKEHSKWDPVARAWGVSTKELGQKLYDASSDVTWRLSDYLTTMRYLEEKANGYSPEEAAARVNKFMSDYHVANTVMGSRKLAQLLTEPAVTAFGRYKAGIFRTLSHMTRDLLSPNATLAERKEALGQWLVMGALLYVAYPAMDAAVQKLSGNEGGEMRRRGVSSVIDAGQNIVTGKKDPMVAATRAWTPAPLLNASMDVVKNRDFANKPIFPQGEWPGVIPAGIAGGAEYAARTAVPPYGVMSQHFSRKEGGDAGSLGAAFLADQFGVGLPSDAANKRQGQIEKINAQQERQRMKRPNGMIPAGLNRLTGG